MTWQKYVALQSDGELRADFRPTHRNVASVHKKCKQAYCAIENTWEYYIELNYYDYLTNLTKSIMM